MGRAPESGADSSASRSGGREEGVCFRGSNNVFQRYRSECFRSKYGRAERADKWERSAVPRTAVPICYYPTGSVVTAPHWPMGGSGSSSTISPATDRSVSRAATDRESRICWLAIWMTRSSLSRSSRW